MARNRIYAVLALGLFLCSEHPQFLSFLPGIPKILSSSAMVRSSRYSQWPGRLEGCECNPSTSHSILDCAFSSAAEGYTVLKFNSSTGQCFMCLLQNVSRYSRDAEEFFYLKRSLTWSEFKHGLRMDSGIAPGQIFEIYGTATAEAEKFSMYWKPNLVWESSEDIALKILFSFSKSDGSQELLLKSKVNKVSQVRKISYSEPVLKVDQPFRMLVLVTSLEYVVYIHDDYCCSFGHDYTNLSTIHYLVVTESPVVQYVVL